MNAGRDFVETTWDWTDGANWTVSNADGSVNAMIAPGNCDEVLLFGLRKAGAGRADQPPLAPLDVPAEFGSA